MAAMHLAGPVEVTLRAPPPLGRPLRVAKTDDGAALLDENAAVIAQARPAAVAIDIPDPVSVATAVDAASTYPWRDRHPYPTCFVCGPEREAGDGLEIFPGPVDGDALYAAPWTPDPSLAGSDGVVREEFVWCALDCPSGIVTDLFGDVGLILLGRLTADLRAPVMAGEPHVVQAWTISREGRKLATASALFSAEGDLRAVAQAVWVELPKSPTPGA